MSTSHPAIDVKANLPETDKNINFTILFYQWQIQYEKPRRGLHILSVVENHFQKQHFLAYMLVTFIDLPHLRKKFHLNISASIIVNLF